MYYKLTSRKFWLSLITILSGIMGLFNISDSAVGLVCSVLMALVPTVVYVITEGKIDAEDIKRATKAVVESLGGDVNADN